MYVWLPFEFVVGRFTGTNQIHDVILLGFELLFESVLLNRHLLYFGFMWDDTMSTMTNCRCVYKNHKTLLCIKNRVAVVRILSGTFPYVVTPERFAKLPQEGNIVLRVEYTVYGANTYVTDIHETDPTLDTIDSSASTMDEITADGTCCV